MKLLGSSASTKDMASAIAILITLMISILVLYNIAASIDAHDLDVSTWAATDTGHGTYNVTPIQNATNATLSQAATFYTIAPIIAIVIIAVVILRYVGMI